MNILILFVSILTSKTLATKEPDLTKVHFLLWTSQNPTSPDIIELTESSLSGSNFNPENPIVILSHGWNSDGFGFGSEYAESYLAKGDYNVFSIDWGDLETWANYPQAAIRTRAVGEHAVLLVELLGKEMVPKMHFVGHSLGAHVVGFLAKKIQSLGFGKVPRVTGLDPAKPVFDTAGPEDRIDKSDGEFVDIIHTNSGWLWEGCLSLPQQLGHVDFYPNGGAHQPGCIEACIGATCFNATVEDLIKGGCSHGRVNDYFQESIVAVPGLEFLAWNCDSWDEFQLGSCCDRTAVTMGEWIDQGIPEGSYFMHVSEASPYALDEFGSYQCKFKHKNIN